MAKALGKPLTLNDLLQAQQKMADKGDARAAEQVKRLVELNKSEQERVKVAKQQRDLQILADVQERQIKKDDDKIAGSTEKTQDTLKKGLLDKTGDGLNANVVKLLTDIKKALGNLVGKPERAAPMSSDKRDGDILTQRTHEQVDRHIPTLKEKARKAVSLESIFDVEKIREHGGGMFGGAVLRKVEENKYVQSREILEKNRQLNLPAYQGKAGLKKAREGWRKTYREAQETRGEMAANVADERRLIESGADEATIKQSGLLKKRADLDKKLREQEPIYRAARRADDVAVTKEAATTKSKPTRKTGPTLIPIEQATDSADVVKKASRGLIGSSVDKESQDENNRLVAEQTGVLKKIESNTAKLSSPAKPNAPASEQPAAAKEESGGILSGIADFAADKLGGKGKLLSKVGGLGKLAKGVGIGGIATLAGEGIQMGGDALKEAGYEQTGKAVGVAGTATKYAGIGAMVGSVIPGVGTAVGAGVGGLIGAGKGIYDQYFGDDNKAKPIEKASIAGHQAKIVNDYQQEVSSGKLTSEQALAAVKKLSSDPETIAQAEKAFSKATPSAPAPQAADAVYNKSSENAAAAHPQLGTPPVIVNAPTTNTSMSTSNYAPKSPPRNTESSYQQYNRARYA